MDLKAIIEILGVPGLMLGVFMLGSSPLGTIIPGDSMLVIAGILANQGIFNLGFMLLFFPLFVFAGDAVGYMLGKYVGPEVFEHNGKLFRKNELLRARKYLDNKGFESVLIIKFVPVVRTFLPLVAGALNMRKLTFLVVSFVGSSLWTWILLGLGYLLGNTIPNIEKLLTPVVILVVMLSLLHPMYNFIKAHRCKK